MLWEWQPSPQPLCLGMATQFADLMRKDACTGYCQHCSMTMQQRCVNILSHKHLTQHLKTRIALPLSGISTKTLSNPTYILGALSSRGYGTS